MILQVGPDAGRVMQHFDAMLLQQGARADAGELQDLRRADAAGAQDDLVCGLRADPAAGCLHLDTGAAQLAVGLRLNSELGHLGRSPEREVGAAGADRAQKGLGGVPAPAAFLVHFKIADAFVVTLVEVIRGSDAGLLRGLGKGVEHIPAQALFLHPPLAARAVKLLEPVQLVRRLQAAGHPACNGSHAP